MNTSSIATALFQACLSEAGNKSVVPAFFLNVPWNNGRAHHCERNYVSMGNGGG